MKSSDKFLKNQSLDQELGVSQFMDPNLEAASPLFHLMKETDFVSNVFCLF